MATAIIAPTDISTLIDEIKKTEGEVTFEPSLDALSNGSYRENEFYKSPFCDACQDYLPAGDIVKPNGTRDSASAYHHRLFHANKTYE